MRLPTRKKETDKWQLAGPEDLHLTAGALERMKVELERLQSKERPWMVSEVRRLAEMGDFSENAGYQIAKGTLRRINDRITTIEERLKHAIIIESGPDARGAARIGSTVEVLVHNKLQSYTLVGPLEANPFQQRISHLSPLGKKLIGSQVGETFTLEVQDQSIEYRVVSIQ